MHNDPSCTTSCDVTYLVLSIVHLYFYNLFFVASPETMNPIMYCIKMVYLLVLVPTKKLTYSQYRTDTNTKFERDPFFRVVIFQKLATRAKNPRPSQTYSNSYPVAWLDC